MSAIEPGTPCFLVHLIERKDLIGRVVEIIGPVPTPDGEYGAWYLHQSGWARELFPGHATIAPRSNLLPLTPPAPEAIQRTSEIVPAA